MKHGFHSAFRSILLAAFAFLTAGSANAQISPVPPCDGPMTIYFSVLYRDCASARANVKVVPNCGTTPFSYQWSNGTISSELLDVLPGTYTATVTDAKGLKATGSVTVLPPASTPFNMNAAVVGLGCTGGGGTGSATVTFSGGTGPFDLKWRKVGGSAYQNVQNVSSPYTITGLTAGNWMIIGNDERACRDTAFVEIKQGLVVTTSTSGATCAGANVTVNASGGTSPYKIAWTGGATLNNATLPRTFSNVPSGPYTFTITDATGCSGTATAQVNGVPNFTIGASSTAVTCTNSQAGSITVTLTTPGTAPYSIQLNNGPAQPATFPFTFNNLAAGEYSIRVTDASNCTSNTNAKVETALDVVLQVKAPASPLCGGSDVAVSLANSGTAPYTITWAGVNGFSGTATVSSFPYTLPNVPPGPITVNVKDATGCTGSETGTSVGNPVMQIRAVNLVHPTCANPQGGAFTVEFVNPGTAPHTLQWSGNATPTAFNGTATFSNLGGGTYTVTVTDANNCTATVSAKIDPALMVVLSPKPAANADCGGQDVEVSLSGNPGVSPYTIEWAGGLGLQNGVVKNQTMPFTISNAAPGSFCVTVTDKEGCVGTACVTVTGNPVLLIKASNVTHPTCANPKGGSFTIEIVSPGNPPNYSVAFNGPSSPIVNGFTYSNLGPGLYEVIVTDGKGCTDSMQVKIESPLDVVLSPQPAANAKCGGADVVVSIAGNPGTPPYTITWSGGNGAQTGTATNQTLPFTISNAAPGQFCVTLTDQEQCLGIECTTVVGPPVMLIQASDIVKPTCAAPNGGAFTISFVVPGTPSYSIAVVATNGFNFSGAFTSPRTFSNLAPGTYGVTVTDGNNCTATTSVKIETPLDVVLFPQPAANAKCGGQDVLVFINGNPGTPPYTITWSGGNGAQLGEATGQTLPFTIANAAPGEFCVTVTDATGCTGSECVTVLGPPVMLIQATTTAVTCADSTAGSITVSFVVPGTAPYTLAWSGPSSGSQPGVTLPHTINGLGSDTYTLTVTDANGCTATTTAKVETALNVVLTPQPAANAKCGGADVVVSIVGDPGTPPYTIQWNGGTATNQTLPFTIANAAPGQFCVTVTDATGCTGSECVTVVGPPVMLIQASDIVKPTCAAPNGGAFTISFVVPGTPNYSIAVVATNGFNFSGAFTSPRTFSNLAPGTYGVTVTDGNNCTATTSVKIETPLDVVLSPQPAANATCGGQDIVVSIAGNPGTPPYTITWSGGGGAQLGEATGQTLPFTIANAAPGEFCVTVTDATGCTGSECITVVGPPVMLIQATTTAVTCADSTAGSITVSFVVPGTAPYTLAWSGPSSGSQPGATLPHTINGLGSGTYTLTVTDANGCTATTTAKVETALNVVLNPIPPANALCGGQDVVIDITGTQGTPPYKVTWSGANGFGDMANVTDLPFTVHNVPPGAFYVTVTDANGCTGTERTSVGGNPVMIIKATPTAVTCDNAQGGSILVEFEVAGTAPYTIAWTGSGNPVAASLPFSISNLAAGNYCITVTDANGCTATTCTKVETALDIVLNSIPPANAACGGADVVVSISGTEQGTPDYTVSWSNADGSFSGNTVVSALPFTIANVPPGAFCVTVTDSKQCTGSECTTVTGDPVMLIQAVGTAVTCADSTAGSITVSFLVPGTAPYSLAWSGPVSGTQSGVSLPFTITGLLSGQYTVTVTDANGCTATAQATVETAIDVILTPTVASDPQCGGGNLIIDINPASATTPPHQYTWAGPFGLGGTVNPATFPDTLENLPLGQYSVTVTDAEGCTGVETAIITGQPKMVIQIDTAVAISCFGGGSDGMIVVSMPVPGIAPYTIQWTGGAPVPNAVFPFKINGLTPGSYTITVTDSKGCTATAEAKIETALDVTLQATPSTNLLCTGGNLIVNVVNGGTPPFDIKWSGPSNGEKLDVLLPDTLKNLPPGEYSVTVTDATGCTGTETATITGDTMFQIAALGTNLNCNGNGSDGSVTITLMQPTKEPYTLNLPGGVQIKNASFPYTLQNLGGGLVSITASDGNGCESSAEAMLTGGPADVSIEALSPLDTCQNQPILLSIKNLDLNDTLKTIKWTVSSPNVSVSPSDKAQTTVTATQAGTYTLTVVATNEHGCSATLTQVVTFDTIESLKGLIEADLCKGLPVQFSNLSGVPGTWNFGDNQTSTLSNPTHTYATPNTYHVTFTAQEKCVLPFDTSIVVKAGPAVTADFGFHVNDCFEKAVIQFSDSTVFTGSGKTWAWTFDPPAQSAGVQNPLITFTQSGTVTAQLIAVDANGCADTTKLEVPVEFVTDKIEELFPFCVGDSIPLNPQGAQTTFAYAWTSSPQDPTLDPTDPTPTVKPTQNTTYQLSITTPSGKCKVDYTAKAEQKPSVSGLDPADLTVCDEDPVTLTLGNTNGSTFVWSDSPSFSPVLGSSSSLTVVPQKDKTYYYKAENGTLCPLQGEVKVNLGKLDIEPTPLDQKVCFGEEALLGINNLDAGDTLQFVWTPTLDPVANPTVVPTQSGTYSVVVTNQFGCADTIQFKVAVIDLQVTAEIIGKDTICVGETAKLLATVSGNVQNPIISWTPAQSLTGANTLNPSAKPDVPTLYTVQVTTAEGLCPDTAEVDLFVVTGQCVEPFIFVPKAFTPNGDNNNDFFVVRGVNITEMLFIVWDRWGEEVYRTTDPSASGWDGTYNGRELTPDSYAWYLKARCGNGAEYIKKGDVTLLK